MVAPASAITFFVEGTPRTKGSLRALQRRRPDGSTYVTLIEQGGPALALWRALVTTEAKRQMRGALPFAGPCRVHCVFYFAPPRKRPDNSPYAWGGKRHDLDKLERAIYDALTDAAVWQDDSQVATNFSEKRYAGEGIPAGVFVEVDQLTEGVLVPFGELDPALTEGMLS
jgi:Holliday junction resolvase RusA-like endonuclease